MYFEGSIENTIKEAIKVRNEFIENKLRETLQSTLECGCSPKKENFLCVRWQMSDQEDWYIRCDEHNKQWHILSINNK